MVLIVLFTSGGWKGEGKSYKHIESHPSHINAARSTLFLLLVLLSIQPEDKVSSCSCYRESPRLGHTVTLGSGAAAEGVQSELHCSC